MHSADERREHGRGERERRELGRAEMADDRRVDEQVQRLGGERAEGGCGQAKDLPVQRRAAWHGGEDTMLRMRRRCLLLGCVGVAWLGACGAGDEALAPGCTERAEIERALASQGTLADGSPLSECLKNATSPATLQNLGAVLTPIAEDLESRAETDAGAARRLGFLIGAARRGVTRHRWTGGRAGAAPGAQRRGGLRRPRRPRRWPRACATARRPDEAAALPRRRRDARGLPRGRGRAGARHAAQRRHDPSRVRAGRRAPHPPLPARPPRSPAARRLRGPPAPLLHAGLVRGGHGGVLHRRRRTPPARRRARRGRAGAAAGRRELACCVPSGS